MTRATRARTLTVAWLSAATLTFEILLVRFFAIKQFHHFAYMAIGLAMLGFGVSGTIAALLSQRSSAKFEKWFANATLVAATLFLVSPFVADAIPFDLAQLAVDPQQWLRLALLYLVLALPFGISAFAVVLALSIDANKPGTIYGASFLGAGLGTGGAVATLWLVDPMRALGLPALLGAAAVVSASKSVTPGRGRGLIGAVLAVLAAGAMVLPRTPDITPYKGLPQIEAYPAAERIAEATSPVGWVVAVKADAFRYAPGLSLAYRGAFPTQTAVFVDGQLTGAVTEWRDTTDYTLLEWLPAAIPYSFGNRDTILVVGAGGGIDVWTARRHGAARVTAIELHPDVIALQRDGTTEHELDAVQWIAADARSFVARTSEHFDLITIGPAGGFGTTAAGVHSLNEDFLHTVDAYAAYLDRLRPNGVLAITRWLEVPPREGVRVILTAARALRETAAARIADGLVVVKSWNTVTILVKPDGLTEAELDALESWTTSRRFDIDWRPHLTSPVVRFNRTAEPTFFHAAQSAVAGPERVAQFVESYPFVVEPVADARPYPHHFLDLQTTRRLVSADGGGWLPFAEWGYLALAATLLQSVAFAGAFILIPAVFKAPSLPLRQLIPLLVYFGALGFGYLAAEISAIQQLSLMLGHPVYAVAAVLAVMLVCSGAGGLWSDRIAETRVSAIATTVALLVAIYGIALLAIVHALAATWFAARLVVAIAVLGPTAGLMGMVFPIGLRVFARDDRTKIAWAWAANGFASVVSAPLAALIALHAGSRVLFFAAAGAYGAAAATILNRAR